jgi:hypothetical protein
MPAHLLRRIGLAAAVGAAMCCCFTNDPARAVEAPTAAAIYHADANHLWNRLHRALFVRVGPDGQAYGHDRLEPLLWSHSKHLLGARSHKQAVALLEEFSTAKGERLLVDPLKRAILQRDLWLVFNWLEGSHNGFADPPLKAVEAKAAQARLRQPLAAAIGRLALSSKEIENLPDNYAAAVASGKFASRYDPQQPDRPYLPADLFNADGPWVCVGRGDGIAAPEHLREDGGNRFTNSVFLVFLRLPAGRAATLDYLKQLRTFDQPLLIVNPDEANRRSAPFVPTRSCRSSPRERRRPWCAGHCSSTPHAGLSPRR